MGSINFIEKAKGMTMQEAFRNAQNEAESEYGTDCYNGQINNCHGFIDVTQIFKKSGLSLSDFIDKRLEKLSKFEPGEGICISDPVGNSNKIKSQVDHIVTPGTKKWLLLYEVISLWEDIKECPKAFNTKAEAVTFARNLAEKYQSSFKITMIKRLEKGNPVVAEVKYKKSVNEKPGEFIFFGYVSY